MPYSVRSVSRSVEDKCWIGRPVSDAVSGMISVALGVNRRIRRSVSRKMVAISVLSSRFFMSSLALDNSSIRA